ncbi:MAG: hypothetical protein LAT55_12620 [Opitutales bacterium]|nr:hypothetical protein [Opitutales bacterium]
MPSESRGYLIIDGNNIGYATNSRSRLTVGDMEVQAIYHTLRVLRPMLASYPLLKPIVLWDGRSWRYDAFKEYKASRDKEPETKSEKAQAANTKSWKLQQPSVKRALKDLGIPQIIAMNLEADDIAGMLVRRYQPTGKKVVLITGDKDWIQLVQPGVGWVDPQRDNRINAGNLTEKLGYEKTKKDKDGVVLSRKWIAVPSARAYLQVKAMMGDPSDGIPGVGGIGEKGAIDIVARFGSVERFFDAVNFDKVEGLNKKTLDFGTDANKWAAYKRNMMLMDLSSPDIPKPIGLQLTKKPMDTEAFTTLCEELSFQSFLTDIDGWLEPFVNSYQKNGGA